MAFVDRYAITPRYLTAPSKRRPGRPLPHGVKFIVAHDTGNPGSTAAANVRYYERSRDELSASAHLFVDDHEIVECIPALVSPPETAWHVRYSIHGDNQLFGADANDAALAVEYCYGDQIDADEAYRRYVWVIAKACHQYGLDPRTSIVGHFFLDPQRRSDPMTGLAHSRRTYEGLLRDVVAEYAVCANGEVPPPPPPPTQSGKVRSTSRLNIRRGEAHRRAPVMRTVDLGTVLPYVDFTDDGEPVNGNSRWFRDADNNFFWSGATLAVA